MLSLAGLPEARLTWDACKLVEGQDVAPIRAGDSRRGSALGAAGDVVEHHAGAVLLAQHSLGGEADILLPGGAADMAHLAELLGQVEPFAQVVIVLDPGRRIAAALHSIPPSRRRDPNTQGRLAKRRPAVLAGGYPASCRERSVAAWMAWRISAGHASSAISTASAVRWCPSGW